MITNIFLYLLLFVSNFIITECIYGGSQTTISEFPYQATVQFAGHHHCGGSIIGRRTILTAAHCVHGRDYSKYSVRVGDTSQKKGPVFQVETIIEHPEFKGETQDKDIAILKLDFPLTWGPNIQAIKLHKPGEEIPPGTQASISGWGRTDLGIIPDKLRAAFVKIIENKKCRVIYGGNKITAHMLCAFASKQDACIGDSGGPLVAGNVQVGIISWGKACAHLKYPGVYTKISEFYEWIQKNKNKKSNNSCSIIK